ncbi:hypothetical protein VMCG_01561 [Cytospora schulzeri]|uniref:Uncharacterized protein n=1 Tax=Cytospora schulzeri TaxID=448051 RepID=A0A423X5R3_9PEZI|nr:hypothetical protein VMCG_01561 [Valsa malicola]
MPRDWRDWVEDMMRMMAPQNQPYTYVLQGKLMVSSRRSVRGTMPPVNGGPGRGLEGTSGRDLNISDDKGESRNNNNNISAMTSSSSTGSRGKPRAREKRVRFSRVVEVRHYNKNESMMGATS